MKKLYYASVLALIFGITAQPVNAAPYGQNEPTMKAAMSSGVPMQGGMPAQARQQMNITSQTTSGGYGQGMPSYAPAEQMYMEPSLQPSVLDAPPAWALEKFDPKASLMLAPFGANLFRGHFAGTYSDGMNSDYVIMPGDRIAVRIWGAKVYEDVLAVDQRGNIFLPEVGPVKVAGLKQSALQNVVSRKLASVFTSNVNIYVNLQSAQPVAVYVTGYVNQPGRYAGAPVDSVMSYLDRAGGILPSSGSFRSIKVKRGEKVVASFDLYDFALNGNMKEFRLKDGDVILVGERGASVAAYGLLRQEARYEFTGAATGKQLIDYGRPLSSVTHVSFSGIRDGKPFNRYLTLAEFSNA
ncbi:MAG: polysaccharide export protein, partial [Mailhella sp.]|nr:polysaccharide export protein [Mailhella sp.]